MNLPLLDAWRLETRAGGAPWTEWHHFLVQSPELHLLINFSVDQALGGGRLIVVAWDGDWHGGVQVFTGGRVGVRPGRVRARLGASTMDLVEGEYRVDLADAGLDLDAQLRFRPRCTPVSSYNLRLGPRAMSWVQFPRLAVHGALRLGGRRHTLTGAPGYHDHNWGRFLWGDDFAWEWGTIAPLDPQEPWDLSCLRTTDRGRRRLRDRTLYVFRDGRLQRCFQQSQVQVQSPGSLQVGRPFVVPPAAALLLPGALGDLPAGLAIQAQADQDRVEMQLVGKRLARIVIPVEGAVGGLVINQIFVDSHTQGRVGDHPLDLRGHGVVEMLRGHTRPARAGVVPVWEARVRPGSLAHLLDRALGAMARAQPACAGRVFGALGQMGVQVQAGDESFWLSAHEIADGTGPSRPDRVPDVRLRLDRRVLRALVGGRLSRVEAVRSQRVDVAGPVPQVLALHRAVDAFVHGALRTPALAPLHAELMEEGP